MVYLSLASLLETSLGKMPILCPSFLRIQFRPHPVTDVSSIVKQLLLHSSWTLDCHRVARDVYSHNSDLAQGRRMFQSSGDETRSLIPGCSARWFLALGSSLVRMYLPHMRVSFLCLILYNGRTSPRLVNGARESEQGEGAFAAAKVSSNGSSSSTWIDTSVPGSMLRSRS